MKTEIEKLAEAYAAANQEMGEALERIARALGLTEKTSGQIAKVVEALVENPPKHSFWAAGEPDCPKEIKALNGELHTLQCRVCGKKSPRSPICLKSLN